MALSRKPQEIVEDSKNPLLDKHESWERVPVGDIADILNGFAFKSSKFTKDKGVPLIRIRDVGKDATETYYDGEFDEAYLVDDGDLLVGMDGDFRSSIWKGGKALLNQRVCKIALKTDGYDFKFLSYVLQPYLDAIHAETSAVTVKHLSSRSISEIPLPLPPKEQQKCIVAKIEELFSHIDAGIEALKKAKQLLKQYRQSVLKAAVTGELTKEWREANKDKLEPASQLLERILKERREKWEEQQLEQFKAKGKIPKNDKWKEKYKEPVRPDPSRIHELPEIWSWSTFDQIGDRVTVGHVGSMKNEYVDEGVPFLRSQNVRENRCDAKGLKYVSQEFHKQLQKSSLQPGDIVTVRSGSVGVTCVIPEHLRDANCSDLVIVKQPKAVIPKLASYYMNTITQTKVAAEKVGVALTHFNTKSMAKMPLPVPPLAEQYKIVELVDEKLSGIEKLDAVIDQQLVKSEKSKKSVLASAFSGRMNG